MATADAATLFVETTLDTRLVVSFLTSATTVADFKRRVTAEHSACFPEAGPIAVKSLQVQNDDGSLFYLNDHVPVEAAFRWDKPMKESNERPASNDQFLRKRKHEGATSTVSKEEEPTVSKEEEPCSMRRRQRIVTVRKMPISKAAKIFGLRRGIDDEDDSTVASKSRRRLNRSTMRVHIMWD